MPSLNPFQYVKTPSLDTSGQMDQASLMQKQKLIDALRQMSVTPQAQTQGGVVARNSLLGPLAQVLGGVLAKRQQAGLDKQYAAFGQQQQDKRASALAALLGGGQQQADPTQSVMAQPEQAPQQAPQPMQQSPQVGGLSMDSPSMSMAPQNLQPLPTQQDAPKPDDMKTAMAKANAALTAGVPNEIVSTYLNQAKEQNKPIEAQHTTQGMVFDPKTRRFMDADGKVMSDADVQARINQPSQPTDPSSIREYNFAKSQGFKGSFMDYQASNAGNRAAAIQATKPNPSTMGSSLTPEAIDLAASRMLNGEKARDVLANFGRGAQGAADLRAVQNRFAAMAAESGQDASDIATKVQELGAEGRTRLELGAREGKIAARTQEAQNFAQVAKDANAAVPRGKFVPFNKLQQMTESQMSDPSLAKLKAASNSLVNAYAAAVGGGTPTVHDKEAAEKMLSSAQSQEAYNAVVDQLIMETQQALAAPKQVMENLRHKETETDHPADIQDLLGKYGKK